MIAICEPQCTGFAHEAINSAFVYAVRLAFPDERIILFADQSHIDAIKRMFVINNIVIDNIEYRSIKIRPLTYFTFSATFYSLLLFNELLRELKRLGIKRLLLLSISSDGLYAMKMLKFNSISCSMALHGVFEWIAKGPYNPYKSIIHRKLFNFKRAIQWRHSNNFNYIALSPHVLNEANKYIDVARYNISAIYLPFIFPTYKTITKKSEFIRFATIGKGSPSKVKYIANALNKRNTQRYEMKIIGGSVDGIEGIANISCVSPNKSLTRDEIEEHVKGVDIFLMLFDKDAYMLSCSGSLFEAFAYVKPIIFLSNSCVSFFNSIGNIGYECKDLENLTAKMEFFINNYRQTEHELELIRSNILTFRNDIDIKNTKTKIRNIINGSAI